MKPTQEQVIAWAREVWGDDSGKPWSEAALLHITQLAAIAYEAGRKDENEACAVIAFNAKTYIEAAAAIRARREQ
jgi:hypothetical protein